MSIKSDKWITRMSARPTHVLVQPDGTQQYFHQKLDKEELDLLYDAIRNPMRDGDTVRPAYGELRLVQPDDKIDFLPMIEPFIASQVKLKRGPDVAGYDGPVPTHDQVISYGVSSYGYDVRCGNEFKVFTNINSTVIDPKNFDPKNYIDVVGDKCIIPPNSFALARTVERFRIPRNVLTICLGKSTYARCGIIVNVTPLEPEWEGEVTLEFSNTTTLPAIIYANEGVAQMLFLESDEECEVSYKDRGGKYQGQLGVTLPRA